MMLPLAGYRDPGDVVLLGPAGEINVSTFFARARELALAIPDATFAINLSESRLGFMLGFAAALIRGQTSLLPSGQGPGDWEQLAQQYPGASIISDRVISAAHAFDLTPYLAIAEIPPPTELVAFEIPRIPADFTAAILFTSGSTGRPTAHAKSWGQLTRGAANLVVALGWPRSARYAVVGSVPPQHMFGLESTVMLPWYTGIPVHASKPLLPGDLETALTQCARPCWWMTTPAHLRAPLQAASALAELTGIVASTMSLPRALAAAAEARWQVPVMEIYGSTETGALATRRTAVDDWWTPLRGVELKQSADGEATRIHATGSHIDVAVLLGDELQLDSDGRFLWLGRSEDMIKIAGKRASLSALNRWIAEIPGIDDAVYFVPEAAGDAASHDDAHPARRIAAMYVSATLSPQQVRAALRARVDPVFVPRPLLRVAKLPRNANGKLPYAALAELFSRSFEAGSVATGANLLAGVPLVVPENHPALPGHFPGNPIVPGVVVLARVADAIRHQLPQVVPGTLLAMRFHSLLCPGQPFTVRVELRDELIHVEVREHHVHGGSGTLIASGVWACGGDSRRVEIA